MTETVPELADVVNVVNEVFVATHKQGMVRRTWYEEWSPSKRAEYELAKKQVGMRRKGTAAQLRRHTATEREREREGERESGIW